MPAWETIEFLINIIDLSLLLYFTYNILSEGKVSIKAILAVVIIQSIINSIINVYFGIGSLMGFVLMYISTGAVHHLLFGWDLVKICLINIMGLLMLFICEIAAMAIILFLSKSAPYLYFHYNILRIVAVIFSKALSFILFYTNKKRFKSLDRIAEIRLYQIGLIMGFNVLIGFIAFWFYKYATIVKGHEMRYIFLMSAASIIFSLAVAGIIRKMSLQIEKEAEWKIKEREFERQKFYISGIEDMLKQVRAQRHDFNHHIGCIYGLLHMNNILEAKIYMEKLTEELSSFNSIINTEDPIISSILNVKLEKAHKEHIKTELDIALQGKLSCDSLDLSIILGNLLDNAIEACSNIPQEKRKIVIEMFIKQGNLIIKISNSKDKNLNIPEAGVSESYTSKGDKVTHGLGLPNIRRAVEKLNGFVKIQNTPDTFEVNIAIPLDYAKSSSQLYKAFIGG